jgi:peptide chain release factor subunit 1
MLTEANLQELLEFQPQKDVLSVYLNTDPTQTNTERYKLSLRSMLKPIDMPDDVQAVEEYLERTYDWSGRSVAIFSCAAEKFFRAYPMAIPLQSRVRINTSPHVKPLANLLDFYGGYGVILIDKQGARVFYFHLGKLIEQEGILGEEIRHTKRGGSSSLAGRRGGVAGRTNYVEEVTDRNMRDAMDFATRFFQENDIRRVTIGGTDDNVSHFRSLLPKSWQSLIVGTFPISMTASKEEIFEQTMKIGRAAELRHEAQLVNIVLTSAAKRRGGVIKLDETLKAVHDGRVQTLVVREGYRAPGYQCSGCTYLTARAHATCPFCGGMFKKIPDAVELAVRNVMQQGGEVEFVQTEDAAMKIGNIGALLRY